MAEAPQQQFGIQRLYVKDLSWEAPSTPTVFSKEWKPELNLDIGTKSDDVGDDNFEVVLMLTATVKSNDEVAFIAEIKQGGIFSIKGIEGEQLEHTLGAYCPSLLYPYAREAITSLVTRGGFPQLILAPINFEALYQQQLKARAEKAEGKKGKSGGDKAAGGKG